MLYPGTFLLCSKVNSDSKSGKESSLYIHFKDKLLGGEGIQKRGKNDDNNSIVILFDWREKAGYLKAAFFD